VKKFLIVGIICLFMITGCKENKTPILENNDDIKTNVNEEVIGQKVIGDLTISNVSLVRDEGETKIMFNVTNNSTIAITYDMVSIKYINSNSDVIASVTSYVGTINAYETIEIDVSTYVDLMDAVNVEYIFY